jgi:hypothetical protein
LPVDYIGIVKPGNGIISIDIFYLVFNRAEGVSHDVDENHEMTQMSGSKA